MPFAQEVRMGSKLRIVLFVVAVFIVLILVLPFLIPVNQFRPTIEEKASAALGRNVQIGDLSLALLRGSLSAENLSIGDDPKFSSSPFLTAKSIKVGVELVPLIFSKTLKITGVSIDTPQVTLLHNAAGVWNFSSLGGAAAKAQANQAPAEKTSNAAADLSISKLELNNGRISIGETGSRKRGSYDNLDITASDVSMVSQFPVTVTADLPQGGKFKLAGTAGPVNQEDTSLTPLDAKLAISALNLALTGFLDSSAGLGGVVDLDGTVSSRGGEAETKGSVKLSKALLVAGGSPAGVPPATRSALESFTLPLVSASPPREDTVPSRSTTPPRPAEESRKPVKARFSALIASLASSGVSEVSSWFTGPAVPASLNLPPCGRSAVTVTGNCETMETSEAVISRLS